MGYDLSEYNPSEQGMYIFIPYDALEKERGQPAVRYTKGHIFSHGWP